VKLLNHIFLNNVSIFEKPNNIIGFQIVHSSSITFRKSRKFPLYKARLSNNLEIGSFKMFLSCPSGFKIDYFRCQCVESTCIEKECNPGEQFDSEKCRCDPISSSSIIPALTTSSAVSRQMVRDRCGIRCGIESFAE
jgi:hypothetical protein